MYLDRDLRRVRPVLASSPRRSSLRTSSRPTPQGVLLLVLGTLAVIAEWSQRTGLVTFEPSPARIAVGNPTRQLSLAG